MSGILENSSIEALSSVLAGAPQGAVLRARYEALAAEEPGLRRRNMAERLASVSLRWLRRIAVMWTPFCSSHRRRSFFVSWVVLDVSWR